MKNLKVSLKLILGFLIITAFAIVLACVGILSTNSINNNYTYLINYPIDRQDYLQAIQLNFMTMRFRAANFVMNSGDTEYITTTALPQYQAAYASSVENLNGYIQSNNNDSQRDAAILRLNNEDAAKLGNFISQYNDAIQNTLSFALAGDAKLADASMKELIPLIGEIDGLLTGMIEPAVSLVGETAADMRQSANNLSLVQICLTVLCVVLSLLLAFYISGMISKPLAAITGFMNQAGTTGNITFSEEDMENIGKFSQNKDEIGQCIGSAAQLVNHMAEVSKMLEAVADCDLTADISLLSESDTMGLSLQKMVGNLNHMFGEINSSAAQVSTGANQIADGAQMLAQGSTQQAATVQQLSAAISQIAEKTKDNTAMAEKATTLAGKIKLNAEKGNRQMDEMMEAVREINLASQNISKVIKVIDDIAFQTNILALNAAVEAARAGQHGKGFAVVAEEVRNLAAKSAEAAKDTGSLIANSMEKAEFGSRIAGETSASLAEIVTGINENSQLVGKISQSSEEQSIGITQINHGIDQVAQVVQQNSATAEQSAAASEEMSGQANVLEELIARFNLKDGNAMRQNQPSLAKKQPAMLPAPAGHDYGKY